MTSLHPELNWIKIGLNWFNFQLISFHSGRPFKLDLKSFK
jgi:hypothetical protein